MINGRVRALVSHLSPTQLAGQMMIARALHGDDCAHMIERMRATGAGNLSVYPSQDALDSVKAVLTECAVTMGAPAMLVSEPTLAAYEPCGLPAPLMLAAAQSTALAQDYGLLMGRWWLSRGVHMVFAPRLDVASPYTPALLGTLGSHPDRVGVLGGAWVMGIVKSGLMACGRAYPGEGSAMPDDQRVLRVGKAVAALRRVDGAPFETGIQCGLSGLLLSDAYFDALGTVPRHAGELMGENLRGSMRFSGVTVAECHSGQDAVEAIRAGLDMVLLPAHPEEAETVSRCVMEAAASGALTVATLMRAALHVLNVKQLCGVLDGLRIPPPYATEKYDALRDRAARASLTRVGPMPGTLRGPALMVLPGRVHRRLNAHDFFPFYCDSSPSSAHIDAAARLAAQYTTAFVALEDISVHPEQLQLARRVSEVCADTRIICTASPMDALRFRGRTVYMTYGEAPVRHPTLLDALRTGSGTPGICPLDYMGGTA